MHHPTDRIAHTTTFVTPVVEHCLEREMAFLLTVTSASEIILIEIELTNNWPEGSQIVMLVVKKERNVLFNDALNTFYLRLYGVRHMVKDHSDSEKGNPLPPHRQGFFYMHHPTDRITHTTAFDTLAGTRNSSMGPHHEGSIRRPTAPWANALPLSYVPLLLVVKPLGYSGAHIKCIFLKHIYK